MNFFVQINVLSIAYKETPTTQKNPLRVMQKRGGQTRRRREEKGKTRKKRKKKKKEEKKKMKLKHSGFFSEL